MASVISLYTWEAFPCSYDAKQIKTHGLMGSLKTILLLPLLHCALNHPTFLSRDQILARYMQGQPLSIVSQNSADDSSLVGISRLHFKASSP